MNSHQLVCEMRAGTAGQFRLWGPRVIVDELLGTVTFEQCHFPRRFWAIRRDPTYTCRLDELRAVHLDWWVAVRFFQHGFQNASISTPHGRAGFSSRMVGFHEVVESLQRHAGPNRGPMLDNPNAWFVGVLITTLVMGIGGLVWALRG